MNHNPANGPSSFACPGRSRLPAGAKLTAMPHRPAVIALLLTLASLVGGCVSTYQELAEKTAATSFESVNGFLKVEHQNREWVAREMPDVHQFADDTRRDFPQAFRALLAAIELVKATDEKADKLDMEAKRQAVEKVAATAKAFLAAITQRKAGAAPPTPAVVPTGPPPTVPSPGIGPWAPADDIPVQPPVDAVQ